MPQQATSAADPMQDRLPQTARRARPGAVRRFLRKPMATGSLVFLILLTLMAAAAKIYDTAEAGFPYRPDETNTQIKLLVPSLDTPDAGGWPHVMGTDQYGRDVFSRLLNAAYISLTIGFLAMGISITLGLLVGAVSGYFGGWIDNILMRFVDGLLCIPRFLLVLTIVAVSGTQSIFMLIAAIGLLSWMGTARLVRAEFLTLRETDYVAAARALGARSGRIIFRHVLPNALAPVFVSAVLGVAGAILTEAGLSFLGFGVQAPQASWGNIIADGKTYILDAWWLIIFPGVAILITTMAFYLVGEGIREVLDPKESKRI